MSNENGGFLLETMLLMMENGGYDSEIESILRLYISCYGDREILKRHQK